LLEGAKVKNLSVDTGTAFPSSPNTGELFFRTDQGKLYVYTSSTWADLTTGGGGGTPGGSNTQVQFNNVGTFGGDPDFTYDATNNVLVVNDGQFVIGTTAPLATSRATIVGTSAHTDVATLAAYGTGAALNLRMAANNIGTPQAVSNGTVVAAIKVNGYDGTAFQHSAAIHAIVDGSVSANTVPMKLAFFTSPTNAGGLTERMTINSAGALGFNGPNYGTAGQVLTSNGSGSAPSWQAVNVSVSLPYKRIAFGSGSNTLTHDDTFMYDVSTRTLQLGVATSGYNTSVISGADGSTPGNFTVRAGNSTSAASGGDLFLSAGTSSSGWGASVVITATNSTSGSNGGGGNITLTAGNATNAGNGGNINLTAGTSPSGPQGAIKLNSEAQFGARYDELRNNITAAASTTINTALGNQFVISLGINITTLTFTNVPANTRVYTMTLYLVQDATGGRTVTWPVSVKWPGGSAPTLTTTGTKQDIVTLTTYDGGSTWLGVPVAFDL